MRSLKKNRGGCIFLIVTAGDPGAHQGREDGGGGGGGIVVDRGF